MSDFPPEPPRAYAPPPSLPSPPPPPPSFQAIAPPPGYPYPAYAAAPAGATVSNGAATAGLVLGIIALFINTLFVPSILGIVFASVGLKNATQFQRQGYGAVGRGPATAGLVCAIVAVLFSLLVKWIFLFLI